MESNVCSIYSTYDDLFPINASRLSDEMLNGYSGRKTRSIETNTT